MNGFPDRASVEKLRYYGIKTVVLHTVIPPGLPARAGLGDRRAAGPGRRGGEAGRGPGHHARQVGSVVIYEIGPGPAACTGPTDERRRT